MLNLKTLLAAAIMSGTIIAPVMSVAQDEQTMLKVRQEMIEMGVETSEIEKLDMASEEQLNQLDAALTREGSEQTKKDEVAAILADIE